MANIPAPSALNLLLRANAPVMGEVFHVQKPDKLRTIQATISGNGAVAAVIDVLVSNDNNNWLVMARFTMDGNNADTCGFATEVPCQFARAQLKSISGTGAVVDVSMGD